MDFSVLMVRGPLHTPLAHILANSTRVKVSLQLLPAMAYVSFKTGHAQAKEE